MIKFIVDMPDGDTVYPEFLNWDEAEQWCETHGATLIGEYVSSGYIEELTAQ